jgi:hypothetical protein
MSTIIVLFNLKAGTDPAAYEHWARTTDLPIVNTLPSVAGFEVLRTTGLLGGGGSAPYQYIEVLRLSDPAGLMGDISTPTMQRVAAEFQGFADAPIFITTEAL